MQIYSKSMKNATSLFLGRFWFCLFLSDRAWSGLQNFFTEFWNSLIMQIYANLFKINEKCYFSVISWPILILFGLSDRAWCGLQNFFTEFWNSLIMQIYANLFKINEKCYFSVISWPILILFGLSDRAWWGLQNFYTEFWNSLIMQIYAYSCKSNKKCYFSISQRILILFVLSDKGLVGASKLLHRIVKFINYANLFKINEKCRLSSIQKSQQICTWGGDVYYTSRNLLFTCSNWQPIVSTDDSKSDWIKNHWSLCRRILLHRDQW